MRNVPRSWPHAKIENVCRVVSGSTPDSHVHEYWSGDITWITPTDLGKLSRCEICFSSRSITKAGYESCATELVPAGSVILSSRAPIGHLGIATIPLCINQGCKAFVPGSEVENRFLYYVLKHLVPDIKRLGSGATFAEVSKSQLEKFLIPVPSRAEQKQIADMLDEQMEAVERARVAAEVQLVAAKTLFQSYLRCVFESGEAEAWPMVNLGEIAVSVQNGIYKTPDNYVKGHPFVRMYNLRNTSWVIDLGRLAQVNVTEDELKSFRLKEGDLLISRVNSFELVGKCGWVDTRASDCVFENMLIRVRLAGGVDSLFVAQQMGCQLVRKQIEDVAKKAIGQASINSTDIRGIKLRLPPKGEQQRIAGMLKDRMVGVVALRAALEKQLDEIKALPSALLWQTFNGEL